MIRKTQIGWRLVNMELETGVVFTQSGQIEKHKAVKSQSPQQKEEPFISG